MFTFVSTAPANPGKGGAANAEMTPLKENVMVPKMLYFKIWSLLIILSTYFKTIPLFFTRCTSTVMQLCANPLLEILVNPGASERVSIDQFYRPCVLSPQVWHKLTNFMFHTQGETLLHLSRENSGLRQLLLAVKGLSPLTETSSNSQMTLYCHEIAVFFGLNKPSKFLNTCSDVIKSHLDSFCYILIADQHLLTSKSNWILCLYLDFVLPSNFWKSFRDKWTGTVLLWAAMQCKNQLHLILDLLLQIHHNNINQQYMNA